MVLRRVAATSSTTDEVVPVADTRSGIEALNVRDELIEELAIVLEDVFELLKDMAP